MTGFKTRSLPPDVLQRELELFVREVNSKPEYGDSDYLVEAYRGHGLTVLPGALNRDIYGWQGEVHSPAASSASRITPSGSTPKADFVYTNSATTCSSSQ